ncbi:M20 family metallopeptidase [Maridesulfovibrio ferrireducens]|uniref:M20 metallopeptidase family protein n=1 Tax=Maridesulfovibrio ferrireducens TaxID=246191 RepID=UPI001A18F6F8|nr:amidohydrolase [Maridesulfovibrio ferrireducens]MBI9111378.1 amidohydrolase [Maridesulfovibrio ferrireducens]
MDLRKIVLSELNSLVELYKHLHANPELSGQEKETSCVLADQLENCEIDVTRNIGGFGIVGTLENGDGPTVMIRTDMDALPVTENSGAEYASIVQAVDGSGNSVGVMHACGHDLHMAAFVGTAKTLSKLKDSWSGRILFVGQPAEEPMSGARAMIDDGLFQKFGRPDYCIGTHVRPKVKAGTIAVRPGPVMAGVFQLKILVRGIGGHGSAPHETRDPVVLAARIISSIQTIVSRELNPLTPAVVTIGSIHGGTRSNIIPEKVVMELTARFFDSETRDHILRSIKRICRNEALTMDFPENIFPVITMEKDDELPATINDNDLSAIVKDAVEEHLGKDHFVEADMVMGSEDFALYRTSASIEIPCCMFFTGVTSSSDMELYETQSINPPNLHNSGFLPQYEESILAAVITMTATVLNYQTSSKPRL